MKSRLEELREKFGKTSPRPQEEIDYFERLKANPRMIQYQKDLKRWNELTRDWSDEDREWAWNFIMSSSQPAAAYA